MRPLSWQYMESLLEPSFQTLQELQGSHHHSEARIRGRKTGTWGVETKGSTVPSHAWLYMECVQPAGLKSVKRPQS
ncbi:rCG55511, isoform CRA_a [Rattus norvegicus]|uniref:RCG55511, isoform CRA_a n=1 Tax=Rattus norvegicus TaxID=10116 RepID=A6JQW4_RAT|nr:rCG55511, isoform CRA_a [Rattus norvegicus]EDL91973.1 rCG55511, isoform CRA_a [Rattus norvegicus]